MSYRLVVTEKPSVAQSIAKVLKVRNRKEGYLVGNGYFITWCVGHLVGLADAKEYDEKYANYYGWQKSGYNKYYQYRATAKNFLAKLATVDDLLFMKAIIEKSLEEVGE